MAKQPSGRPEPPPGAITPIRAVCYPEQWRPVVETIRREDLVARAALAAAQDEWYDAITSGSLHGLHRALVDLRPAVLRLWRRGARRNPAELALAGALAQKRRAAARAKPYVTQAKKLRRKHPEWSRAAIIEHIRRNTHSPLSAKQIRRHLHAAGVK